MKAMFHLGQTEHIAIGAQKLLKTFITAAAIQQA